MDRAGWSRRWSSAWARRTLADSKVVKLNVDDAPAIAARYDVQGIPLLVLIRDGSEADRLVGAAPLAQLKAWLEPHLKPAGEPRPVGERP